jgi:hypothetical protein
MGTLRLSVNSNSLHFAPANRKFFSRNFVDQVGFNPGDSLRDCPHVQLIFAAQPGGCGNRCAQAAI